mgnify:CR=1 FL=1
MPRKVRSSVPRFFVNIFANIAFSFLRFRPQGGSPFSMLEHKFQKMVVVAKTPPFELLTGEQLIIYYLDIGWGRGKWFRGNY